MLIGSESILARVHWEHTCSKLYSPIELGELLSKRSFTATGEVNMLATRKRKARLEFNEDDVLEAAEPEPWEPRSPWFITDGLDSIRWCYILFEIGEERQVHKFFDEMIRRVRSKSHRLEQFREYYSAASWTMCMMLRTSKTFQEASDFVLQDMATWNEHMAT